MAEHLTTLDKICNLLESLKTEFKRVSDRQREQDVEIRSLLAVIRVNDDTSFDNNADKTNTSECCKSETKKAQQAVMDNFINKVRAEMSKMSVAHVKQKTNLTKSHSFSERPTRKKIASRTSVSDPLLKDEKEKHEAFRTVCLSQSIQRHLTDIIENTTAHKRIPLPDWLSAEEIKFIQKKRQRRNNNLRKFLMILRRKDFGTMYQWVHNNLDQKLKQMILETFNEFCDEDLNKTKYRCLRCRMSLVTCVTKVADQLKSVGILSDELYLNIIDTHIKTGSQETLWDSIFEECKQSQSIQIVNCAFKVSFGSLIASGKEAELSDYKAIYCSISSLNGASNDLLVCK
ncbi:hypothetical protein DPMN_043338 [Dreissena polymorpha]|uniref:Uncharacterized protein n=1 Tax=Dreissena polymorpha TaxID=45954 RepID=A0A9D4HVH9_DREPO|nr:hypothetical protein DPMN_043338 [Dreissena polymorpha]